MREKPTTITIASRASRLALWQAEYVRDLLAAAQPGVEVKVLALRSSGEIYPDRSFGEIGVGIFTREIDAAVLDGRADIAVHSLKDMPTEIPDGLALGAVPERADTADAWVSADSTRFVDIPQGAKVGTSSPRRAAQLRALRPDITIVALRGNVETRLRGIRERALGGTVLAVAGLRRLEAARHIAHTFSPDEMVPAVGQGAIGIVTRARDENLLGLLRRIEHAESRVRVNAERAFLRRLRGGCQIPAGALAGLDGAGSLRLDAVLCSEDGGQVLRERIEGPHGEAEALGEALAERLLAAGGAEILARIRAPGLPGSAPSSEL